MSDGKFGPQSRYAQTPVASRTGADGQETRYLRRRFLPHPKALPLGQHTVAQDDRLDAIAAATLGDAQLWWRIADSHLTIDPSELTATLGRTLKIAIEEDVPVPEEDETGEGGGSA